MLFFLHFFLLKPAGRTAFLKVSNLGGCGGPERMHFPQFLLWAGVVVLKELIFNSFFVGRVWWS